MGKADGRWADTLFIYAASTYAPPMLDQLLDTLTTHALSKMQPGGGKKSYTSKNIGGSRL